MRKFSLSTILAIVKAAGPLIQPHIAELVGTMLEALSSLESQQLSYSQMHAGDVEEQFEAIRVMLSKNSVMSQINEACLKYVGTVPLPCTLLCYHAHSHPLVVVMG